MTTPTPANDTNDATAALDRINTWELRRRLTDASRRVLNGEGGVSREELAALLDKAELDLHGFHADMDGIRHARTEVTAMLQAIVTITRADIVPNETIIVLAERSIARLSEMQVDDDPKEPPEK